MPPSAIYMLLGTLLAGTFLLYVAYRALGEQQRLRKENDKLKDRLLHQIAAFLEREASTSRAFSKKSPHVTDGFVATLRTEWLNAEHSALVAAGRKASDFAIIDRKLRPLFTSRLNEIADAKTQELQQRITDVHKRLQKYAELRQEVETLRKALAEATNTPPQRQPLDARVIDTLDNQWTQQIDDSDQQLKQLMTTLFDHQNTISELRKKIRDLKSERAESTTTTDQEHHHLEHLLDQSISNASDMQDRVKTLEAELIETRKQCKVLAERLREQEQRSKIVILEDATRAPEDNTPSSALADLRENHNRNQQELDRLRDRNAKQRKLILELESKLNEVGADDKSFKPSHELIERLKIQLRDSEMCTAVLEAQTAEMRAELETMRGAGATANDDATNTEELEELNLRLDQLEKFVHFTTVAVRAHTLEELVSLISNLAKVSRLDITGYFHSETGDFWFSNAGNIDKSAQKLLCGLAVNDKQPWEEIGDGIALLLRHSRYYFAATKLKGENSQKIRDHLLAAFSIADAMADRINRHELHSKQKHNFETLVFEAKKGISSLEVQRKYFTEEGGRSLQIYRDEITNFVDGVKLTPVQRECFDDMLSDFAQRLNLLFESGLIVNKSYVTLVEKLSRDMR